MTFINGFLPLGNESFNFLTYGSVVGDFAVKEGLDAGNGAVLSPTFGPHGVELMVESVGPINVTSQVSVASSDLTTNHADKQLYGTIDITNTHGGAIPGSLAFVWQGLTSGVKVQQVSVTIGTVTRVLKVTKNASGDPQVVIPESLLPLLASGQTIQLNVRYKTSSPGAIDFTPQLIEAPLA